MDEDVRAVLEVAQAAQAAADRATTAASAARSRADAAIVATSLTQEQVDALTTRLVRYETIEANLRSALAPLGVTDFESVLALVARLLGEEGA